MRMLFVENRSQPETGPEPVKQFYNLEYFLNLILEDNPSLPLPQAEDQARSLRRLMQSTGKSAQRSQKKYSQNTIPIGLDPERPYWERGDLD